MVIRMHIWAGITAITGNWPIMASMVTLPGVITGPELAAGPDCVQPALYPAAVKSLAHRWRWPVLRPVQELREAGG